MAEQPVVNTSPLVFLSRAHLLPLLRLAGPQLVIPRSVVNEIAVRGPLDSTVRAIEETDWLQVVEDPGIPATIARWDLGAGESAVLAWAAAHPGSEVVMDDLPARRCAAELGIRARGTLGLVLVAKQRGLIPAAKPVLDQLHQSGMYLSRALMTRILELAGE